MALAIATVADSISKLSVSGLTLKDIDAVPAKGDNRAAILIPAPEYITGATFTPETFGETTGFKTVQYTLNYRLLYAAIGTGRTMTLEQFAGLVAMVAAIWDAVLADSTITGCVDIIPEGVSGVGGAVSDPGGGNWWGCDMGFRVTEHVNA